MINHTYYVPILKWKMGEYQALSRLEDSIKDRVVPLIEIPPVGYDFEAKQDKKTLDEHLSGFGKKLFSKWGARQCLIDLKYICSDKESLKGGMHPCEFILQSAREAGCSVVPVLSLASGASLRKAVKKQVEISKHGGCIRLLSSDFDRPKFKTELKILIDDAGFSVSSTDLVLDLCADAHFVPKAVFRSSIEAMFALIPSFSRWRSVVLSATSYPETLQKIEKPVAHVPRLEWLAYMSLIETLSEGMRIPAFSDYVAAHPALNELDMRFVQPFAKLRYTTDDFWHIAQGKTVRSEGFGQYVAMCAQLVKEDYFDGPPYSEADEYIDDCAAGNASTGNLSTWVWVATNRHITKVVADLASLHATLEIDE